MRFRRHGFEPAADADLAAIRLAIDCVPVAGPVSRNYRHGMVFHMGLPEASRRAFWARLYARRHLLSKAAAPFAPAHYALIGEKLGYRPNAFFDPHYFRDRASIA